MACFMCRSTHCWRSVFGEIFTALDFSPCYFKPLNWQSPAQTVTQPPQAQQTARIRLPHLPGSMRGQFQLDPSCPRGGSNAPEQSHHLLSLRLQRFPSHSLIFSIRNKARWYPEYSPDFATDPGTGQRRR